MIILDTNVISELMKVAPNELVIDWLDAQGAESVWTTSVCVFEISFGIQRLPEGKRKRALRSAFDAVLEDDLQRHVLDFDLAAAEAAGLISAHLESVGRPVEIRDVQIAGIVAARRATLATGNTKHFRDTSIATVNPWEFEPSYVF